MKKFDVLAIGELNVDLIMAGMKSMPVVGRETIAEGFNIMLGSSTAICACGMSRLGLKTGFVGKIGGDSFGEVVRKSLDGYGICLDHVIVDEKIKTGITISLSTEKDRAMVTYLGSIDSLALEDIDYKLLDQARHIHIGSFFLQSKLRPGIAKLFSEARKRGVTTSLDAGWDYTLNWDYGIFEVLGSTDIFFPNETEALNITKKENTEDALNILSEYCRTVVVKCGPRGALAKGEDLLVRKPAYDLKPIDTTGAGDSFNAGFIYAFINKMSLGECMDYGNACGSISVTRIGGTSACATLDEVNRLIKNGTL
ncbi:MAG: carbohydrate kinase family protein [Ruminiclostridium sp.]|nr:carbohydrate kinase family protein [Ruminiclostridium sp.]